MTGAGGAATPYLIERLQTQGFRVIAADMDEHAIGLLVADKAFVIPGGLSPKFLPVLQCICADEQVDAVVPLVDEELIATCDLEQDGIVVLLPRPEFIRTCLDKALLMERLKAAGIGIPDTRLVSEGADGLKFPLVVKPRTGRGSRGVAIVDSASMLASVVSQSQYAPDRLLLQDYIDGPEFTISVVVWRDGEVQAVVPKEIISKRGITRLAITRRNPLIDDLCRAIQKNLRADGPFNVQLRLDGKSGLPKVFEINPRFSTTVSLTIAAGVDEVGGLLRQAFSGRGSFAFPSWKQDLVLIRRYQDEFQDVTEFERRTEKIARN